MPGPVQAKIVLAQATVPAPGGYASGSRKDLIPGQVITATNQNNADVIAYEWTLSPPPWQDVSAWSVSGQGSAACTMTPPAPTPPNLNGNAVLSLRVVGAPVPGQPGPNVAEDHVVLGIGNANALLPVDGLFVPHPLEGQVAKISESRTRELEISEALYAIGSAGGGGGGGDPRVIVWNPDNGSPDATKGEAQTEAQMKALVQAVSGPALVYCIAGTSGTYTFALPTWDGQGSTLRPHPDEDNQVAIFVDDGVQLEGWDVEGLELHFNNTTPSTRAWNNPRGLYRARGCKFVNDGTAPVLFTRRGTIDLERCVFDTSISPILVLDSAAAVVKLYTRGGLTLSANTIEGVAGSQLAMLHDGMLTKLDDQATFLGTFGNMPLGTDGGSGSFAVRPRDAGPLGYEVPDGCLYRCTTIGSDVRFIRAQNTWEVVSEDGTFVRITRRMGAAIGRGGGSYNTGTSFYTWHERYIIGARFWWVTAGGTPETVRVSIWKGGSAVHSEDFVIQPGTTFNEVAFTSAYHVPNADAAVLHKIAVWDTSGAGYTKAVGAYDPRTFNNPAGDLHEWDEGDMFGAGFTDPATAGITENYPVEPRYGMAA